MSHLVIVVLIGVLILIHELGHFLAGRWMKIPIARFSVGFGPKLWGFRRGKTMYQLSLIPLGGYVLPEIVDGEEYFKIPYYKRIVFALGGPLVNIGLPLLLFAGLNVMASGFSFVGAFISPFSQTFDLLFKMVAAIPRLFSDPDQLSGIVGIVAEGGKFVGGDIQTVLHFSILLSLNLAIFNLLPIPPLDGGKILLYLLERIHKKLLKLHMPFAIAGWLILIGLMLYVTALDIGRIWGA